MFKRIVATFAMVLGVATAAAAVAVPASALDVTCTSSNSGQCSIIKTSQTLDKKVWGIMQTVFMVLGGAAVIMIIAGGMMYTISAGDPAKVKNAKNTIIYAVVGLVVAILAASIITFVISYL